MEEPSQLRKIEPKNDPRVSESLLILPNNQENSQSVIISTVSILIIMIGAAK